MAASLAAAAASVAAGAYVLLSFDGSATRSGGRRSRRARRNRGLRTSSGVACHKQPDGPTPHRTAGDRLVAAALAGAEQVRRLSDRRRSLTYGARAAPHHVTATRLAVGTVPIILCFAAIVVRDTMELRLSSDVHRAGLAASLRADGSLLALMLLAELLILRALRRGGPDAVPTVAWLSVVCFYVLPASTAAYTSIGAKPFEMCPDHADAPTACANFMLSGIMGFPIAVLYFISGLPAHMALGAEALRAASFMAVATALAAAHPAGVSAAWLAGNVARCAVLACALPVLTAALTGVSNPPELARLQLCPHGLRPLRDALVAFGELLRGVAALRSVQRALLLGLFAYFLSYMTALLFSSAATTVHRGASLAVGWLVAFAAVAGRGWQLQHRRLERHLRSPARRRVHAMHLRLNSLDADPDALLAAAADELLAAFPHGCSVALAEFAPELPACADADGDAPAERLPRLRRAQARSLRDESARIMAAAVSSGVERGGSAAAAVAHPSSCAGLTLDAEDYTEGDAAFADWQTICAVAGAGPGGISVTLLGTGLDVIGAMWVHAPQGVTPPAPAVLRKFAEGVGAALLRCAAVRTRLTATAAEARADADATLALQRAFISGITHELRTPLNAIIGFSATILEESAVLEPHLRDNLRCSLNAGNSLLSIVNQLLDYAKFEASNGKSSGVLTDEPLCLRSVLDEVVDVTGGKAAASRVALSVELDADLQAARLRGDPARVRQVLVNLVDNAIKFSPEGASVSVAAAACAPMDIHYADDPTPRPLRPPDAPPQQWARITVADTGRGVPPEHQWRLFRPFSQIARQSGEKPTGTGLGLVLCRSLARQMGGDITFVSQPGVGTTFTIMVPFDLAAQPPRRRSLEEPHPSTSGSPRPSSSNLRSSLSCVTVLTALPACGVGACIARMAATWGATATEVAAPEGADAPTLAQRLRVEALSALDGSSVCRAVLLIVDSPTLVALCASPLPARCVAVLAAPPGERADWTPAPVAARGYGIAPAAFLELPTSPGRLQLRLAAALFAAVNPPIAAAAAASAPAAPVTPGAATPTLPPLPAATAALRVLLVEDNHINARVAAAVLGRCGITAPVLVGDGADAVAAVAAASPPFEIILMDMHLPTMDGPEAARRIRAHEVATGRPHAYIVACTASSAVEDREECMAAGMDVFLEKPMHPDAMRSLLLRRAAELERAELAEAGAAEEPGGDEGVTDTLG